MNPANLTIFTQDDWKTAQELFDTLQTEYLVKLDERGQSITNQLRTLLFDQARVFSNTNTIPTDTTANEPPKTNYTNAKPTKSISTSTDNTDVNHTNNIQPVEVSADEIDQGTCDIHACIVLSLTLI